MMRPLAYSWLLLLPWLTGCGNGTPTVVVEVKHTHEGADGAPDSTPRPTPSNIDNQSPFARSDDYERFVTDAFALLNEGKSTEALAALKYAQGLQNTPFIQREIARLEGRLGRSRSAAQTAQDIQLVLNSGRGEEAARLATSALAQYGDTEIAPTLARLKRQADAMFAVGQNDQQARIRRCVDEANAAMQVKNLRAAAIAYDQAVQAGADATIAARLTALQQTLSRYDDQRTRADELRRHPDQLEDALAAYQEAAKAWDTLQLQQDIAAVQEAIAQRRPTLAIADVEVRGDLVAVIDGRALAEELVDAFRPRFHLVERAQLNRIFKELQLDSARIQNTNDYYGEVNRLAQARYLIVGSVSRLGGLVYHARLVDLRSGLVVQTAKVVAPTPQELVARLPQAARMLQMSDEQKIAYEQQLASQAVALQPVVIVAAPAPLPDFAPQAPPTPIVLHTAHVPGLGGLVYDDFTRLPKTAPTQVVVVPASPVRDRAVQLALEVGDNYYQRGLYREASHQYEFALSLAPGRQEFRVRLDRCRPHLPMKVVEVVRPRLAVLSFVELGDAQTIPPGTGCYTANQMAPYFQAQYDVIDRGEIYWWMGRLGLSMRDVVTNPAARTVLARAVNSRFVMFGSLRQNVGIDVETNLVDAEYGHCIGGSVVKVSTVSELKFRIPEIARLTLLSNEERQRLQNQSQEYELLLAQARQAQGRNDFKVAINVFNNALKIRPNSVEVSIQLNQAQAQQRAWELEEARRIAYEHEQQRVRQAQEQALALATAAEQARIQAEQERAYAAEALQARQQQAYQNLLVQARFNIKQKNFAVSINLFESALGIQKNDAVFQELVQVRAQMVQEQQARLAQEQLAREAAERQQRDAELARARQLLEEQQRREAIEAQARLNTKVRIDQDEADRLIAQAKQDTIAGRYDEAVSRLQTAKRLRPTREIEGLLNAALVAQARGQAESRGAQARAELESQLMQEQKRRKVAEALAEQNQQKYVNALKSARSMMAEKKYQQAVIEYQQALLVQQTDEAAKELRQAREALASAGEVARMEQQRRIDAEQKLARVTALLTDARNARNKNQYDDALVSCRAALKIAPDNQDAITELTRTEQARDQQLLQTRRDQQQMAANQATMRQQLLGYQASMKAGRDALGQKRYTDATQSFTEALRLQPNDAEAKKLLGEVTTTRDADYRTRITTARNAFAAKRYDDAITAANEAMKALPNDPDAKLLHTRATQAKNQPTPSPLPKVNPVPMPVPMPMPMPMPPALPKVNPPVVPQGNANAEFQKRMTQGEIAERRGEWDNAAKAYVEALKSNPTDATAKKKVDFVQLMSIANSDLTAKRFDQAASKFQSALQLYPNDPSAKSGLLRAKAKQ